MDLATDFADVNYSDVLLCLPCRSALSLRRYGFKPAQEISLYKFQVHSTPKFRPVLSLMTDRQHLHLTKIYPL